MRVWMIGAGNMAGAMLNRWTTSGTLEPANIFVANRHDRALPDGVRQGRVLPDGPAPDVVVLGVKPQQLDEAAAMHAARVAESPVLVSMLAGTDAAALRRAFPGPEPVACLPNLPVAIGAGVVPIHAPGVSPSTHNVVDQLMTPLGTVMWLDDGVRYAAASAMSGCGPAFAYRFIDALAGAAVAAGLARDEADALAKQTVAGAAALAQADARSPHTLADAVASPGGMTRAGLDVLDDQSALSRLLENTLGASIARGEAMAADRHGT